ncbi:MAG: A/G-specific adenine glycosylase [Halobacteriaceae archaeon]
MSDPISEPASELDNLDEFRQSLLTWYDEGHRSFPWRETTDPYRILVSEVMSQQTQLSRVREGYEAFIDRWPTVNSLASASRSDVVAFWSNHSLGYNNRARYLHEAAKQIISEFDGEFPREPSELQTLQGVGPYTANAVASFAFNNGNAVVDTNVKRVLHRALSEGRENETQRYEETANALMPAGESRRWNNAIMELGGTICGKTPRCDERSCPLRNWCHAYKTGDFTAPDVQNQPTFEGSRRQFRGRIIQILSRDGPLSTADLGPRVRVDHDPESESDREWLTDILADLEEEGLVEMAEEQGETIARLK